MDNKLSELSKPKAFVVTGGTLYQDRAFTDKSTAERSKADRHDGAVVEPLYSQEYVSALKHESAVNWEAAASLNVENQELKKRITELKSANKSQDDHINQQQDRIESLENKNGDLGRALGAAEKRLATPVRLSCETHPRCRTQHAKDVRAAGFTVEGDSE